MATLIRNCPYCGAKDMTFTVAHAEASKVRKYQWNVLLTCASCGRGAVALVEDAGGTGYDPAKHPIELDHRDARGGIFVILDFHPRVRETDVPEHLPPAVAKAFKEGCEVLKLSADAAFSMFRKALELGLKDLSPEVDAYKLHRRIDVMAEKGLLTQSLKDWSHHLRLDANEMIHEAEKSDTDHAREVEEFTRFVLIYLFTLPESMKIARGAA